MKKIVVIILFTLISSSVFSQEYKATVTWFDTTKGVGMCQLEEGLNIFFRYTELPIENGRIKTPEPGDIILIGIKNVGYLVAINIKFLT